MKTFEEADEIRRAYMTIGTIAGAARACGCTWRTAKAAILRDYTRNGGRSPRRHRPSPWRARIEALLDANADDEWIFVFYLAMLFCIAYNAPVS